MNGIDPLGLKLEYASEAARQLVQTLASADPRLARLVADVDGSIDKVRSRQARPEAVAPAPAGRSWSGPKAMRRCRHWPMSSSMHGTTS